MSDPLDPLGLAAIWHCPHLDCRYQINRVVGSAIEGLVAHHRASHDRPLGTRESNDETPSASDPAVVPVVPVVLVEPGPVEVSVRTALARYTGLTGMQAPLAEMATRLSRAYDGYAGNDLTKLARLNQELRQTLQVIAEVGLDVDDDRSGGLPAPVRHAPHRPADLGSSGRGGGAPTGQAADAASG